TRMLIAILRGNFIDELVEKGYDKLKTFGAGRDIPQRDWQDYLLQMLNLGYFEVAYNENNHLKITSAGAKVLYGQEKAMLVVIKREEKETKGRGKKKEAEKPTLFKAHPDIIVGEEDQMLFEELRMLRKRLADQQAIPAYIVLSDKTLHQLAIQRPTTLEEFGMVSGIGEYKKERYGKDFVETIKQIIGK
ncbi:MAG: HRDC domain-containing protein, partial [Bacteroides sp.]|nr:HRDC domain-containing protein [Bacteroides sp.]